MTYISLFTKSLAELHIISYILETELMLNLCEVKYALHLFKEGHLLYIVEKYIERSSIVFLSSSYLSKALWPITFRIFPTYICSSKTTSFTSSLLKSQHFQS